MASTASSHVPCGYNGHYHLYMTITQNNPKQADIYNCTVICQ